MGDKSSEAKFETKVETKVLSKIEKALRRVAEQQEELCGRIDGIESRLEAALRPSVSADARGTIEFLDQFRAGEALGELSLGAWIEVCRDDCLRGGLRVVQNREGFHARLLEERIKQLGGSPKAEVPQAIFDAAMQAVGDPDKSDATKLVEFTARFPDCDAAIQPILDQADQCGDDAETASLLRNIAQDERATLVFLSEACVALNG